MPNFSSVLLGHYEKFPDKIILHIQKAGKEDIHLSYRDLIEGSALILKCVVLFWYKSRRSGCDHTSAWIRPYLFIFRDDPERLDPIHYAFLDRETAA